MSPVLQLPKPPDPEEVLKKLKEAITNNTKPRYLLFQILTGKETGNQATSTSGVIANALADIIVNYRDTWLLLTSPEGKRYIKEHLDDLLDYWEKLARETR